MKRTKQSEPEEALQADRWYKKNTDEERDNPEQPCLYLIIYITYCVYCTYTTYESKIAYDTQNTYVAYVTQITYVCSFSN